MRACVQRVSRASVEVDGKIVGQIQAGLLVLLGVGQQDDQKDLKYLVDKIVGLRIFSDDQGKMNRSVGQTGGQVLVVSQFTLMGDCRKGRRPSFVAAGQPDIAKRMYDDFVAEVQRCGIGVQTGVFQADMKVDLCNDGPVTLILDSRKLF